MANYHRIKNIKFESEIMYIIIDDKSYTFNLRSISTRLLKATDTERANYQISPSGYGIHWPSIDEDLSIDGLLGIKHTPTKKNRQVSV
jgi:hypothetical protein